MHHEGLPDLTGLEIDGLKGTETIADRRFWKFQRLDRVKDHFAIEGIFRKPLEIKSIPRRAEIYLDDGEKPVGLTDLNGLLLLTLGQHLITLRKNGYLPRKFSIEVNKDTPGVVRQVLLRQVRIFAKEANSLDDSDIGARIVEVRYGRQRIRVDQSTPTELRLLPYRYTIVFKKPGYEDLFLKIPSTKRTVIARMKRLPARVAVLILDARTREPVNAAEVFYRNLRSQTPAQKLGVTDSTGSIVAEIPAGRYQIEAKKIGYQARAKILNLRGARMNRYTFLLRVKK
ncbi:MAG: hypothetical protein D6814_05485 [Calditrichaeota bacterium]|nr:MAG: hypothetical protein D6814_05485 [Calditrichota bacterium]